MLFYLFSAEELNDLFSRLGCGFHSCDITKNIEYYQGRTAHGSTLSRLVFSWVFSRADRTVSWNTFRETLMSDVDDIQGGTTKEGIHLGAMAGSIDIIQRCYTGMEIRDGILWFNPRIPNDITSLAFTLRYRGNWLRVRIEGDTLELEHESKECTLRIGVKDTIENVLPGEKKTFNLPGQ
jgi:trehalose/maltose hydrolase-like predicted phosphorylase